MSEKIVALVCGIEVEGEEGDPFPECGSDHDVGRPPIGDPDEEGDPDDDEEGDSDDDEEGGSDDDEKGGSDDDDEAVRR